MFYIESYSMRTAKGNFSRGEVWYKNQYRRIFIYDLYNDAYVPKDGWGVYEERENFRRQQGGEYYAIYKWLSPHHFNIETMKYINAESLLFDGLDHNDGLRYTEFEKMKSEGNIHKNANNGRRGRRGRRGRGNCKGNNKYKTQN